MRQKGENVSIEEITENISRRDEMDQHRKISPLRKADDAIVLDNSNMTLQDEMRWFEELVKTK